MANINTQIMKKNKLYGIFLSYQFKFEMRFNSLRLRRYKHGC